jgi:tRNA threonylcarbamoyladenosine biosynthesis protein TsaE
MKKKSAETVTASPRGTRALAARFARRLPPGAIVFLDGPLGAGKTVFVKGMALGLGADPEEVHSPSFLLLHDYGGLLHIDCYRLQKADEAALREAGILEALEGPEIKAVEWAPAVLKKMHPRSSRVRIDFVSDGSRRIRITVPA